MMSSPVCVVSWYRGLWWFRARLCMLEGWLNTLVSSESSFTRGFGVSCWPLVSEMSAFLSVFPPHLKTPTGTRSGWKEARTCRRGQWRKFRICLITDETHQAGLTGKYS